MWRPGEDGQEARTLQKLPEARLRPVAQEQVGVLWLEGTNIFPHKPQLTSGPVFMVQVCNCGKHCVAVVCDTAWLNGLCLLTLQTLLCRPDQLVPGDQSH